MTWLLTTVDDGQIENSEFPTEWQAWDYLIREHRERQDLDFWLEDGLESDELLGRVAALSDEDKEAIRDAFVDAGLDIQLAGEDDPPQKDTALYIEQAIRAVGDARKALKERFPLGFIHDRLDAPIAELRALADIVESRDKLDAQGVK